jgi:DNA repair photolyase
MKQFKGKAIYQPAGKAAEYSEWACNFYVGCSGGCTYCYLKKGRGSAILGGIEPELKACFKDEKHALEVFEKELQENLSELKEHGLFLSFTTEPALKETYVMTIRAIEKCMKYDIPVKILTKYKLTDYTLLNWVHLNYRNKYKKLISIGFTLTGHDELEMGISENHISKNLERIDGMKSLHNAGFKTFASIEPVLNYANSLEMIELSNPYCDLFKIGLESGKKYTSKGVYEFVNEVLKRTNKPIYFKDSLLKAAGIQRDILPRRCVTRYFKLHECQY